MTRHLDHLSQRDLERLSAYLDGELSEQERSELEARLEEERRLQGALEELEGAVGYLRRLPQVRPPRNYALTPQVVGQRQATWGFPMLQFATAVAALLLVAVVGLDAVTSGAGVLPAAPAEQVGAPFAMQAAPTTAPMQEEAAEAPQAMQAEPEAESGAADEGQAASEPPTPTPGPTPAPTSQADQEQPAEERSAVGNQTEAKESRPSLMARLSQPGTLRWVELVLGGLVIVLGFLTYRARPAGR
ncbi:MAG: zf-HC2 domain-containing protein [Anaerolineales bacterium]|nr:zf-HC2 domain-containing protein [Anaerolineales bacterium]